LLRRAHCSRVAARWKRDGGAEEAPAVESPAPSDDAGDPKPEAIEKAANQRLAQEQTVFERKLHESDALFRLQLAMGWMTFFLVPASVIAGIVYPPSLLGTVPLNGLAIWSWRRILNRRSGEIEVTTKRPGQEG
jgi:hypothetical protein